MNGQYRPRGFTLLPVVVKNLLIINGLVFIAQWVFEARFNIKLPDYLGLHLIGSQAFEPWQFVTYMFLHGDLGHIFFNMFALWMFGYALENIWGPRRFLVYYFVTGIGAALVHYLVLYVEIKPFLTLLNTLIENRNAQDIIAFFNSSNPYLEGFIRSDLAAYNKLTESLRVLHYSGMDQKGAMQATVNYLVDFREYYLNLPNVIGASGAVFGILLAFGMLFPNTLIFIYFLFPIKAKYFVIIYGLIELFYGFSGAQSNVAHFAHLGGMVFGFFLIWYWKKSGKLYN